MIAFAIDGYLNFKIADRKHGKIIEILILVLFYANIF